jgi:hypothetical protein
LRSPYYALRSLSRAFRLYCHDCIWALLWSLKRQLQNKNKVSTGHYVVNRLIRLPSFGLPIAMLSYLCANRFLQLEASQLNYEICLFSALGYSVSHCITHSATPLENSTESLHFTGCIFAYFQSLLFNQPPVCA